MTKKYPRPLLDEYDRVPAGSSARFLPPAAPEPTPPLRVVPTSVESLSELFQLTYSPDRRDIPDSAAAQADLAAWQSRRPTLNHLEVTNPKHHSTLETARLREILRRFARGVGWAAGESIRVDADGRPVAFQSRPSRIGRCSRSAIQWLSDACGLRALFIGQGRQEWALLAVHGVEVQEFSDLVAVLREVGVDPTTIAGQV